MTFADFLRYIREHLGKRGNAKWWSVQYDNLEHKTYEHIKHELPYLAVRVKASDYPIRNPKRKS